MGYDGYSEAAKRLPQWECANCKLRALPPRPTHCPQCQYSTEKATEHAPMIWRNDIKNRVGWTPSLVLLCLLTLSGCGLGFRTIPVPMDLKPLNGVMYYNWCTDIDNQECHLFYVGTKPITLTTWNEPALPFGTVRYAEWMGDYPFWSRVWFPFGLPANPGDHCGVQVYGGIKVEGTVHREMQALFQLPGYPLEFKPSEQHAFRVKCDLEVVPDIDNMAGY